MQTKTEAGTKLNTIVTDRQAKNITLTSWFAWIAALWACFVCVAPQAAVAVDWTARNGPEGGYVARVAVDYTDSNIVYLANYAGIFKSTNGGTSWTNLNA